MAECQLIADYAYERFIDVEPWRIVTCLAIWRQWYYGMIPTDAILRLPGVRSLRVSER